MRIYQGYYAARLDRVRPPSTPEILRHVPRGSRRLLGKHIHRLALDGASMHPAILRLRAKRRAKVLAVLALLAARAVWMDGTAMLTRDRLIAELGISLSTWQRCRQVLEDAGILGVVRPGRCYHDGQGNVRNDSAVYVICLPKRLFSDLRKKGLDRRRAQLRPQNDPPTVSSPVVIQTSRADLSPGPEGQLGPPSGRTDMASPRNAGLAAGSAAGRAMARVMRNAGGPDLTDGWCGHIARPYLQDGWTPADLEYACCHATLDGPLEDFVVNSKSRRLLQAWLAVFWLDDEGRPRTPPSRRAAAEHQAQLEQQTAEHAARIVADANARPPSPEYLARTRALFPGLPPGRPAPQEKEE